MSENMIECKNIGGVLVNKPDPRARVKSVGELVSGQKYTLHICMPRRFVNDPTDVKDYMPGLRHYHRVLPFVFENLWQNDMGHSLALMSFSDGSADSLTPWWLGFAPFPGNGKYIHETYVTLE